MGDRPTRGAPPLIIAPLYLPAPGVAKAIVRRPAAPPAPAWRHAHVTMANACRLLVDRVGLPAAPTGSAAFRREIALRWAGNSLKELDRFLSVLLDACAPAAGMPAAQIEAFERSHDTPRKLRRVERLLGRDGADTPRLQAIGRLRRMACGERDGTPHGAIAKDLAIATAGQMPAVDVAGKMPAGDVAGAMPAADVGGADGILGNATLATIARFYQSIADRLDADCTGRAHRLDFSSTAADIPFANVACDGI